MSITAAVSLASAAAALILMPSSAAAQIGYTVQSNGNGHLYRVDLVTGLATDLGAVGLSDAEGMTWMGGTLYGIGGTVAQLWDLTTPPGTLIGGTGTRSGIDAGLGDDPTTGLMYDMQGDSGASYLYSVNPTSGATSFIGSTGTFVDSLAIDASGAAYSAAAAFSAALYSVNLSNGALSLVGSLGLVGVSAQAGMDFDDAGVLWMLLSNGDIYSVSTATGLATLSATVTDASGAALSGFEGLAINNRDGGHPEVPEPGTAAFLVAGALGLVGVARRRRV